MITLYHEIAFDETDQNDSQAFFSYRLDLDKTCDICQNSFMTDEAIYSQGINGYHVEDIQAGRSEEQMPREKLIIEKELESVMHGLNSFFYDYRFKYQLLKDASDRSGFSFGSKEDYITFERAVAEFWTELSKLFVDKEVYSNITTELGKIKNAVDGNRESRRNVLKSSHTTEIENVWQMLTSLDQIRGMIKKLLSDYQPLSQKITGPAASYGD